MTCSYVLALAALVSATVASAAADPLEEVGSMNGAQFRIYVPQSWNRSLVLWCHGYDSAPGSFKAGQPPRSLAKAIVQQGYAFAESGYSAGGLAVNEALRDTENLRRYFGRRYGTPKQVFVAGESMGGMIALALVESRPAEYNGGLAFCGMLSTPAAYLRRAFDLLVLFAAYAPDILPPPGSIPASYKPDRNLMERVGRAIRDKPAPAAALRVFAGVRSDGELAEILVFHTDALKDLAARCGGNPFDNRSTLYDAGEESIAVNRNVPRFQAVPAAAVCSGAFVAPRGILSKPFLAVDAAYDPIVPAWCGNSYLDRVSGTRAEPWFVRQFTATKGHCSVPLDVRVAAFRDLTSWAGDPTTRPKPGLR
jgi:pimeloyl-ACP methyl ester carboxylesterase